MSLDIVIVLGGVVLFNLIWAWGNKLESATLRREARAKDEAWAALSREREAWHAWQKAEIHKLHYWTGGDSMVLDGKQAPESINVYYSREGRN